MQKREEPSGRIRGFRRFLKKTFRVLAYARPYWKLMAILFLVSLIFTALSLAGPYLVKILLDDVLPTGNTMMLFWLMVLFVSIFVLKSTVGVLNSYKTTELVENIILGVKKELFDHLEKLDLSFYHTNKVGDILYRLDEDVYGIDSFINIIVNVILMDLLSTVFILAICLKLNWRVTVASLMFFPFYVIAQRYFGEKIRKQKERIVKKVASLLGFLQENLSSIHAIKTLTLEKRKLDEYTKRNRNLIKMDLEMDLIESFSSVIVATITFIPLIIILWYGSYQVFAGVLTLGSLIAIYTYIGKLFDPIASLGSINIAIQSTLVSVDRVFEFLDRRVKIKEKPGAKELTRPKGKIDFKKVSFSYHNGEPVLDKISLSVEPGMTVGIVGPSGTGKSTIGNLLLRFFDPQDGRITIDGTDLRDLKIASLRKNIGIVSQESVLFNTTIRENIRLGDPNASDEDIIRAAKLANIHDMISHLRHGYHTVVGERGATLSGGEKQRISIARIILKNPSIIILDEATSSLDSKAEEEIQDALKYVTKGRTTIIIAHRLSTVRQADKILVLKDHKIVESGSFKQLMKKKGEFYHYYYIQFGKKEELPAVKKQPFYNPLANPTPAD